MGPDAGSEYFFSPFETINLSYLSPYVSNNSNSGYEEITLDDYSSRTANGKYIIESQLNDGSYFLMNVPVRHLFISISSCVHS